MIALGFTMAAAYFYFYCLIRISTRQTPRRTGGASTMTCPRKCIVRLNQLMTRPSERTPRREQAILATTTRYCSCQRQLQLCAKKPRG